VDLSDTPGERVAPASAGIMQDVPDHPSPQTRSTVAARISAHVKHGWPHLGEPVVTYRGPFCYVAARLPGQPQPQPILGFPSYRGDIGASRSASPYPRCSREELGGRFLGLMAYLESKDEGDNSLPEK
jgi:hypothetical protein